MRRRPGQILMIVLALVLVVGAAGCGKKKSATSTTTTTVTSTTTTAAATTTTESTSTATTTTTAATTTNAASSGLGSLASSANCKALQNLGQTMSQAFSGAGGDVTKLAALMKQFADKAPAEVRADFETYADFLAKVAAVYPHGYKAGQPLDAATLAKLTQLSSALDVQKLTAAAQHLATWAQTNCVPH